MFSGPSHVAGGRPGDKKDDIDGILPSTPGLPVPAMPTIFDMFSKHYSSGLYLLNKSAFLFVALCDCVHVGSTSLLWFSTLLTTASRCGRICSINNNDFSTHGVMFFLFYLQPRKKNRRLRNQGPYPEGVTEPA